MKDIFNTQVNFEDLSYKYQNKVFFESIKKINEFNKTFTKQKKIKIMSSNNLGDLRSRYINLEDYKHFENLFEKNGSDKKINHLCALYYEFVYNIIFIIF